MQFPFYPDFKEDYLLPSFHEPYSTSRLEFGSYRRMKGQKSPSVFTRGKMFRIFGKLKFPIWNL